MRLAVIGSRGLSVSVVDVLLELQAVGVQLSDIELIISGGAVGVDFVANELSDTLGVPLRVFVPDYINVNIYLYNFSNILMYNFYNYLVTFDSAVAVL